MEYNRPHLQASPGYAPELQRHPRSWAPSTHRPTLFSPPTLNCSTLNSMRSLFFRSVPFRMHVVLSLPLSSPYHNLCGVLEMCCFRVCFRMHGCVLPRTAPSPPQCCVCVGGCFLCSPEPVLDSFILPTVHSHCERGQFSQLFCVAIRFPLFP